ncbi:GDSL-type esterase/lipase family protein [Puia sp.]|jgi:lysophospholipase L1-like esterase|uniref:GDSL-type esterase/lipase family protein n=1 Tax=Puia sp. TaxID=2045100 RepID=UPI002F4131DC
MNDFYRLLFPLVIFSAGCSSRPPADGGVNLKNLVTDFFRGIEEKDTGRMRRLTTDDFVLYEEGLVWNNDSGFNNIRRSLPFYVKYVLSDFVIHVDVHSGDARFNNHADFVFDDTVKMSFDWVESATFRKTADGWKMNFLSVARHMGYTPPRYDTMRFARERYAKRVTDFAKEPIREGGTVFLGNSLTEFGDWKKLLNDSDVVNRGIAGDNTFGMLDRLGDVLARRPKKIFIEAGINDLAQDIPPGVIVGNILVIMGRIKAACPGGAIYVHSVLPTNADARTEYPEVVGKNALVVDLDRALKSAVEERGGVYIDVKAVVEDGQGDLDRRYAKPDGLHLNSAGYAEWANLLRRMRR